MRPSIPLIGTSRFAVVYEDRPARLTSTKRNWGLRSMLSGGPFVQQQPDDATSCSSPIPRLRSGRSGKVGPRSGRCCDTAVASRLLRWPTSSHWKLAGFRRRRTWRTGPRVVDPRRVVTISTESTRGCAAGAAGAARSRSARRRPPTATAGAGLRGDATCRRSRQLKNSVRIKGYFELFSNIKRYPLQTRRAMNSYYPIIRLGTSFMRQLTCQVSNSGNLKK